MVADRGVLRGEGEGEGEKKERGRNVPALDHEIGYYAVEDGVGVVIATGECCKVVAGFGCVFGVEFDGDSAH